MCHNSDYLLKDVGVIVCSCLISQKIHLFFLLFVYFDLAVVHNLLGNCYQIIFIFLFWLIRFPLTFWAACKTMLLVGSADSIEFKMAMVINSSIILVIVCDDVLFSSLV